VNGERSETAKKTTYLAFHTLQAAFREIIIVVVLVKDQDMLMLRYTRQREHVQVEQSMGSRRRCESSVCSTNACLSTTSPLAA
jgi:hypothetical protein